MSEPFLGEIKMVGFNFAPLGYAQCDGQILPISQNQSLFALLGTIYGGDGRTSFALPDLRSRSPLHFNSSFPAGVRTGIEEVALTLSQIPTHNHRVGAANQPGNSATAPNNLLADAQVYQTSSSTLVGTRSGTIGNTGSSQGHENMQPFTVINFVIALTGLFPPRN